MDNPCIRECFYNDNVTLCTGCFRTPDELSKWLMLSKEEKVEIMKAAKKRRKEHLKNK